MAVAMSGLLAGTGCGADVAAPKPVVARSTTTGRTGASAASSTSTTAAPGSTTTLAAATTSPPADGTELAEGDPLRAEIETAYRNAVQAFIDAAAIPDPNFPALAQWNVEPMLGFRSRTLAALRIQGRAVRYPAASRRQITVVSIRANGNSAELVSCQVDDAVVYETETGAIINDDVSAVRMRSRLARGPSAWQLAEREELGVEGDGSCAE